MAHECVNTRMRAQGEDGFSRTKQATNAGVAPLNCYTNNASRCATLATHAETRGKEGEARVVLLTIEYERRS